MYGSAIVQVSRMSPTIFVTAAGVSRFADDRGTGLTASAVMSSGRAGCSAVGSILPKVSPGYLRTGEDNTGRTSLKIHEYSTLSSGSGRDPGFGTSED